MRITDDDVKVGQREWLAEVLFDDGDIPHTRLGPNERFAEDQRDAAKTWLAAQLQEQPGPQPGKGGNDARWWGQVQLYHCVESVITDSGLGPIVDDTWEVVVDAPLAYADRTADVVTWDDAEEKS